jgi:LytS/YehU family sensor histidine kinase
LFYLIVFFYPDIGKRLLVPFLSLFVNPSYFATPHTVGLNFYNLTLAIQTSFWGALFYLGVDWYRKKEQKKELERQNLQSELKLLKNQVNPHFLFNTLNNIDRLIASNPDKASAMLVGLSGMMRYMVYDTNANISPLSQEIQQIRNYIDLQEMQYANPDLVAYSVEGNHEGIELAPMLFIPFIENAFKHCTDKMVRHAIRFSFRMEDNRIYFESVNIANPAQHIEKDSTGGIGLETVKRRLELLYPGKHQLQIDEKNDLFCVSLNVDTR